jgi:hypothetical protein
MVSVRIVKTNISSMPSSFNAFVTLRVWMTLSMMCVNAALEEACVNVEDMLEGRKW